MMVGKGQTPNRDIFRALFCDPGLAHETVGLSIDFKMTIMVLYFCCLTAEQ